MKNNNLIKTNRSRYTWKIFKPLMPIIFLAIWAHIFEDTIWKNYKEEKPIMYFKTGELQWEYDMDSEVANDKYKFNIIQFSGRLSGVKVDTLYIDETLQCILGKDDSTNLDNLTKHKITVKGRIINYNKYNKIIKLDNCYIQ
tara:strand:- start:714 stop:1139 length:426 start_codon:yes stop_codon:yes gene_type:complete